MRAALVTAHGRPPEVGEHPEPVPGPGQALLRVAAAPITPLDLLCASGTSYFGAPALPYVPGVQGVGVVERGDAVAPGTRAWFPTTAGMAPGDGAMAPWAVVDEADLVAVDGDVDDAHLAALGLSAVAAWTALLGRARLQPGERVLVLGSSGVVGRVGVQVARLHDAAVVFAAAREPDGAQDVTGFVGLRSGESAESLTDRMREVVGEVDVVLDPLCGVPATAAALCLAPGGRLVNLGGSAGAEATFSSAHLRSGSRSVLGHTNNDLTREERAAALAGIAGHASAGRLSVPHEVVGLDGADEVWARQQQGRVRGRAVVAPGAWEA